MIDEIFHQVPLSCTGYSSDHLNLICRNLKRWPTSRVLEELEVYLVHIFPPPTTTRVGKPSEETVQSLTRRQARRAEYARTQRSWRRNPCRCLRAILKDKVATETPSEDIMVPYWSKVMTGRGTMSPGVDERRAQVADLWTPISRDEVKGAFPSANTAPGPDGLTARQLRSVPMDILWRIFNIFLVCGKIHLLESRTTLIPKKNAARDPGR